MLPLAADMLGICRHRPFVELTYSTGLYVAPYQLESGCPGRDAQLILGHSRLAVTQEIYTHEDRQAQHDALTKISKALRADGTVNSGQLGVNHHLSIMPGVACLVELRRLELLTPCLQSRCSSS